MTKVSDLEGDAVDRLEHRIAVAMKWDDFEIGFWHPFGDHGGETRDQIIRRKQEEIRRRGWTLWSFQWRRTAQLWVSEILKVHPKKVYALCSDSHYTKAPLSRQADGSEYQMAAEGPWSEIPPCIRVPHPFGGNRLATAFVVKRIIPPELVVEKKPQFGISWFRCGDRFWRSGTLPSRGEYLIKRGVHARLRPVYAVLELAEPYIALLRH